MLAAGPKLYVFTTDFSNPSNSSSTRLYVSDGTAGGTMFLHEFANESGADPTGLPNGNIAIALGPGPFLSPTAIWVSNGTAPGTQPVAGADARAGFPSLALLSTDVITPINGQFYFEGTDAQHGTELWQSDGTSLGTSLVQDINPGPGSSNPEVLAELNGHLMMAADDGRHGTELLSGPIPRHRASPTASTPAQH
jgi:ELWxxDGT repeat protein